MLVFVLAQASKKVSEKVRELEKERASRVDGQDVMVCGCLATARNILAAGPLSLSNLIH